jgi:SAM-dependent methyltransferase
MKRVLRERLYPLYCAITGRGGDFLAHKKEFHQRRRRMERGLLEEYQSDSTLLEPNVCPACGSAAYSRTLFSNPVGFSFSVCQNDDAIYLDPVPSAATLQRLYNHPSMSFNYTGDESFGNTKVEATNQDDYIALVRMIGPVRKKLRLLEVGCATGGFLKTASQTFDVDGVELNDTTAGVARLNGFHVKTGRLSDISGESKYSVIVMLQVLEHIVDPKQLIADVHRLLEPDGYFFVSLPNIDSASMEYLGRLHIHVSSFGHVSLYRKQSLCALGKRCGLEMLAHEYHGGRDLELHDVLALLISKEKFYHRMALYSPRLYYLSKLVNAVTFDLFSKLIFPAGNESYQRALFKKSSVQMSEKSRASNWPLAI